MTYAFQLSWLDSFVLVCYLAVIAHWLLSDRKATTRDLFVAVVIAVWFSHNFLG